ncbi:3'-phosphoadenosine 5'-phosphosulfate sulfotransferase (PAPS reductase)/FAD synthetase [Methanocalculus alkaliphilus]|uniref:hypothetical protein n=1 Tax=Methanocalculus alkaliphilus TaxID=768730 RepID=UPI0020A05687|nr:hypothetical protein [Methanocalculus alkaliphilus]MCP1716355.1 3'-phosphoadenosine 5'-phosphosulfate sulfotransferase (PAPS reductase)/FAD synthetase [Methanocalculus alkaliphilus]
MDTTVPIIKFDEQGVCEFCYIHDKLERKHPLGKQRQNMSKNYINKIKEKYKNNEYDYIVGISGGRDSTYTLHLAKEMWLCSLAFHTDNGWNSDFAVNNNKNATEKLKVDLHSDVADWEVLKDLQMSFIMASVTGAVNIPDVDCGGAGLWI